MRATGRDLRWVYCVLVGLRIAFAFSPGYIHPDEWFQFGEVLSGDLFGVDVLKTWEFDPTYPCRSMASIRLFGLPFFLPPPLLGRKGEPSPWILFITSRSIFLALSFVLDYSTWQLLSHSPSDKRWAGMALLAGSGAILSFSVRSFSNNVEAALLALSFVCIQRLSRVVKTKSSQWSRWSSILGALTAAGVFSRFTFVIFALPLGLAYIHLAWKSSGGRRMMTFCRSILPAVTAAIVVALLHILYDSWYYSKSSSLWPFIITPVNAALYNLKSENLAAHGVHPRYLHGLVNAPLILGLGPYLSFVSSSFHKDTKSHNKNEADFVRGVLRSTIIFSILMLSLQPHQEPRFLLPLVMSICVLYSTTTSSAHRNRILLYTTIVQSMAVTVFFSFLHQAGTIPAMLDVSSKLSSISSAGSAAPIIHLLFWRSFMPPRHLIIPSAQSTTTTNVLVKDCQSMAVDTIIQHLLATDSSSIVLFAPSWVLDVTTTTALQKEGIALTPLTRQYPHVDTDHLGESIAASRESQSLLAGFSFAGYLVDR